MARAKKNTYTVSAIKPISNMRRYEHLRANGVAIGGVMLRGKDLDDYIDRLVWEQAHPGQNPVKTWKA